jgi:poly-beta-1,6-N-acetyl-D-glucosamine synthase
MADHIDTILLVVFCIFASSVAIQLFYYLFFYLSVYLKKPVDQAKTEEAVSVIICARNEAENLTANLTSILEQDYHDFEVIVVNDCSEDNSYIVLGEYMKKYPHLRISTINKDPKFTHYKKFAQFIGIKAAKNELLLFTDADCMPVSNQWLKGMVSNFSDKTNFVLGYGGYLSRKGFLNRYIRYDSFTIAMQYLGMAIRRVPYMGVGRNMAYRRSVFFENKGFGAHSHIISGDDDLLVNAIARGRNTAVELRAETHTRSVPSPDFSQWILQKKRHFTTAPYYKFRDKFLLFLEPFTRVLCYASFIVLLCFTYLWPWVLGIFALRLITQVTVFALVQKKLNETGLIGYLLFFDIFSPLINSIIYLSNSRNKPGINKWK